jgi:hypothetical protein
MTRADNPSLQLFPRCRVNSGDRDREATQATSQTTPSCPGLGNGGTRPCRLESPRKRRDVSGRTLHLSELHPRTLDGGGKRGDRGPIRTVNALFSHGFVNDVNDSICLNRHQSNGQRSCHSPKLCGQIEAFFLHFLTLTAGSHRKDLSLSPVSGFHG